MPKKRIDPSLILGPGSDADASRAARKPRARATDPKEAAQILNFAVESARLIHDLHGEDILLLDVRGLSELTDYVLIASGTSERQIRSLADDIDDLAEKTGVGRLGRELDGPATWVVLDFVDVVVHLFEPATRAHYDLEMLWGDAEKLPWRRNSNPS
ncbi:MAG: ribosome silencing factor [Phycisphaeraceae bacterium]|nr:ribosome silencing factor [Phycisphaeraceae bacterium]